MTPPADRVETNRPQSFATSLTLLERAKGQDQQAWERLVALYAPLVYRVCRVANVAPQDAADVAQEVLRAVSRNLDQFRRDRTGDSFRAWLLTISRNKIKDYFRRQAKTPPAVGGTDMQAQIQQLPELTWESSRDGKSFDSDSNLMRRTIQLVRGDFGDKTWQAFWSTTIEGQSPDVVAKQLGVSRWSVYQAKTRVLRRVREELEGMIQ